MKKAAPPLARATPQQKLSVLLLSSSLNISCKAAGLQRRVIPWHSWTANCHHTSYKAYS